MQQSIDELTMLENLAKNPDFQMLWGRLRERSDNMADSILHDELLSAEEREKLRTRRLELLEVLKFPSDLQVGHERALSTSGHHRGDIR